MPIKVFVSHEARWHLLARAVASALRAEGVQANIFDPRERPPLAGFAGNSMSVLGGPEVAKYVLDAIVPTKFNINHLSKEIQECHVLLVISEASEPTGLSGTHVWGEVMYAINLAALRDARPTIRWIHPTALRGMVLDDDLQDLLTAIQIGPAPVARLLCVGNLAFLIIGLQVFALVGLHLFELPIWLRTASTFVVGVTFISVLHARLVSRITFCDELQSSYLGAKSRFLALYQLLYGTQAEDLDLSASRSSDELAMQLILEHEMRILKATNRPLQAIARVHVCIHRFIVSLERLNVVVAVRLSAPLLLIVASLIWIVGVL